MSPSLPAALAALVLTAALAGCVQPAPEPAPVPAAQPTLTITEDRPDPTFGAVSTGPGAGPDLDATTAAPPRLVRGEWWRIKFASPFFGDVPEMVRVVADVNPEGYVMGMPHEGWFKEALAFHMPAFGDVGLDLSFDTHNVRFEPVRFPLVEGATWETAFGTQGLVATVEEADATTATIRLEPPAGEPQPTDPLFAMLNPFGSNGVIRMYYDARQHEVVRVESDFFTWEVVEHGYDYEGWVTVPRGMQTAIDHGVFLPAAPGSPMVSRTLSVEGGFNRLTLLHIIVPLAPGAYRIRALAPDGTEFLTESIGGRELMLRFYEANKPDGAWNLEDLVGGAGATYSMGMAYHQYDIRLPDGARRADHAHDVIR